jgi:hypothetical protein
VEPVRVLFIGGTDRSGSTLLDLLLGRQDGFVSVGELRRLWDRGLQRNELCGCGAPLRQCPFWSAVIREAFGELAPERLAGIRRVQRHVERLRHLPELLFRPVRSGAYRTALGRYTDVLRRLYRAIASVSGADVIIDSSKHPVHGVVLGRMEGVDRSAVHLVRDSRAVAYSMQRVRRRPEVPDREAYMARRGPLRSALEWDARNAFLALTAGPAAVRVRYEELVERPDATVRRIVNRVRSGTGPGASGNVGAIHTVSGNPTRFSGGRIEIRPDTEWRTGMAASDRLAVTALTWPLLLWYGYELR